MNGDGLPDHVTRSGSGSYSVAVNRGDGTFEPADWGSGMTVETYPALGDLSNDTDGISSTGTGSFGATAGISGGISGGWSFVLCRYLCRFQWND